VQLLLDKPVDQLRNTFSNLALPLFTSAEPDPPKATKAKTNGKEWTWTAVGSDTVRSARPTNFCAAPVYSLLV
jgi:hypothetical protein